MQEALLVKNPPTMQEALIQFLAQKIPWRRDKMPTPVFLGFPAGSDGKESTCNEGALDWGDRLEWHGNPLQYSCLENPYGQRTLAGYSR